MILEDLTASAPMVEDNTSADDAYRLHQDRNDWIPQAEEALRDEEMFLPQIISSILNGALAKDWNRQYRQYWHSSIHIQNMTTYQSNFFF